MSVKCLALFPTDVSKHQREAMMVPSVSVREYGEL